MKNIEVDKNLCIGCGACVAICPQNFDFDEDGLSTVINDTVTKEAVEASEVCPVYAIKINTAIEKDEKNTEENVESEEKCTCGCDSKENKESEEETENDDSECCGGCHCCNGTCCEGC